MSTKRSSLLFVLVFLLISGLFIPSSFAQDDIACGDIIEDELDGDTLSFAISVEAGQYINISLVSDEFDTLLEVYEDGDLVLSDDDGGAGLNSLLSLSEEGDYEIVVTSFAGNAEGEFTLTITCADDCDLIEDELTDDDTSLEFDMEAEEGDVLLVLVRSDAFDTYLNLLDEDEDLVASNDDGGDSYNSLLVYEVEDDGDYIIEVTSFSGDEEGDFTLVICADAGDVEVPEETDLSEYEYESLECGDVIEGTISNEFPIVFYVYEGTEGEEVTITLSASSGSSLDAYLGLFSPTSILTDETVAENDDTNGTDSEIEYELEEDGSYLIVATRYGFADGASEGDYELELECEGGGGDSQK